MEKMRGRGMRGVKAIVWDVDDTLYLERSYVRSGFRAVGEYVDTMLGVAGFSDLAWNIFEQGGRGKIFNDALDQLEVSPDPTFMKELIRCYRKHAPDISLLPDARKAIDHLCSTHPMAVITDGPPDSQNGKIHALGLRDFAAPCIATWEWGQAFGKPHPRAFESVEATLGLSGTDLVYVADNPEKDFVSPKNLGWHTIRLRRDGGLNSHLPTGDDVDHEMTNLDGLVGLLEA
jgi:putative hydrolase of the HAD superfamily